MHHRDRGHHRPDQHAARGVADIGAKFGDVAHIMLIALPRPEKVQLSAFDEPKMKPNPLATLQVKVPTFTALCADAGPASAANAGERGG
jgi:hypothetical protein